MAKQPEKNDRVTKNTDLHAYIQGRVQEAQIERGKHEGQWQINDALYMGLPVKKGSTATTTRDRTRSTCEENVYVAPRTQNAVIASVAIQTETPPRWSYVGRETNEQPDAFLMPPGVAKAAQNGFEVTPAQAAGKEPIPFPQYEQMASMTRPQETGEIQTVGDGDEAAEGPVSVNVPVFNEDDFVLVDDQLAAEALTQEVNSEFDIMSGDEFVRMNILQTNVVGHDDSMVQWIPEENRFTLTGLYPYNVWIDPEGSTTRDSDFVVIRQELTLLAAKREYPDFKKVLEEEASTGTMASLIYSGELGGKSYRATEREFVERITMWERNHPYKLTAEEAFEEELIQPHIVEAPDGFDDFGQVQFRPMHLEDEQGRPLYLVEGEDTPLYEGESGWPVRYGIRQVEMLNDYELFDGETEFSDIPISRNKNIPILYSPYAMGEPQRLQDLQELYNSLLTIFQHHFKQYKYPQTTVPASVLKEMGMSVQDAHKRSVAMWALPDSTLAKFGADVIKTLPVPQINQAAMSMFQIVRDEMDNVSGMTDTLRGVTKSDQSARLFSEATAAARGPIGYKAQHTSDYLKHIGAVAAGLIIEFLPTREWVKRNRKYPAPIIESMRSRLKRVGYDVVPVVGGSGGKQNKVDKISSVMQQGVQTPTLLRELMDALDIDEAEAIANELQQTQQAVQ